MVTSSLCTPFSRMSFLIPLLKHTFITFLFIDSQNRLSLTACFTSHHAIVLVLSFLFYGLISNKLKRYSIKPFNIKNTGAIKRQCANITRNKNIFLIEYVQSILNQRVLMEECLQGAGAHLRWCLLILIFNYIFFFFLNSERIVVVMFDVHDPATARPVKSMIHFLRVYNVTGHFMLCYGQLILYSALWL